MKDRRSAGKFPEKLSAFMVSVAALGGFLVLVDPRLTFTVGVATWTFGGEGFSPELKGAVVTIMLIGGWTAVKEYWLGASATGQTQTASMMRMAEGSTPAAVTAAIDAKELAK